MPVKPIRLFGDPVLRMAAQPVTIPVGTRAQSIPDPNQSAQTFEATFEGGGAASGSKRNAAGAGG